MAAAAFPKNSKIAISRQRFDQSARNLAYPHIDTSNRSATEHFQLLKIQDGGRLPSCKIEKYTINGHY